MLQPELYWVVGVFMLGRNCMSVFLLFAKCSLTHVLLDRIYFPHTIFFHSIALFISLFPWNLPTYRLV